VPKLVIKSHRPWQLAIAIMILSMVMALITWLLLDNSYWRVIRDRTSGNMETKHLLEAREELLSQNKSLQDQVLMLEQTTRLDMETATLLQGELILLQDEVSRLKRELEFYQAVMDTARKSTGIDIHGLHVEPLNRENHYLIKLVLTNVAKSDRVIEGNLDISLEGLQDKQKLALNLGELSIEVSDFAFEFKNFSSLEYRIELPAGFLAERMLIQVNPRGESVFSKIFDWPVN